MPLTLLSSHSVQVLTLPQLSTAGDWQIELSHHRQRDLLIWLSQGQGDLMIDGQRMTVNANDALFIPAGTLWSLKTMSQTSGRCLQLPTHHRSSILTHPLVHKMEGAWDRRYLSALFEQLQREQNSKREGWQSAMSSLAHVLQIHVNRNIPAPQTLTAAQRLSRAYCERVVAHYRENITMGEHANALKVTPTHLTRVCKAETGKTAAMLLTERQLYSARALLAFSDLPIQDIASQLGFGSPAYFTRFISQHTGNTPSRLRKVAQLDVA